MRNNLTGRENVHHWWVSGLLYVLILSQFFLVPLAWLGSAAGLPLRNLLSSEGIRWYYLHIQDCFHSRILMCVFPVILMAGAMERSGLSAIVRELWKKGRVSLTYRQRRACWMSGIFLLCVVTGTILLMLGPNAILLNVTGHIYPSPFWFGIVLSLFMELMATALVYAALSFHLRGWQECLSGLYWGIQRHAAWLLVAILFSHLYHTLCYVLENVTMGALLYE